MKMSVVLWTFSSSLIVLLNLYVFVCFVYLLNFVVIPACYVTAQEPRHNDATFLQNELTLTAWIQSTISSISGCVVAKTSLDGSMVYYALVLATLNDGTTAVQFQYHNNNDSQVQSRLCYIISFLRKSLLVFNKVLGSMPFNISSWSFVFGLDMKAFATVLKEIIPYIYHNLCFICCLL